MDGYVNADQSSAEGRHLYPGEIERLNRAFALALNLLGLVDRNDPVCEMVARKIISVYTAGAREPEEIAKLAVARLGS
jgi:hypothetical protein